jgi:hypothetical protein
MTEDHHQRLEQMASAIEDLLQMGAIRFAEKPEDKALLSPQFSHVVSNTITSMQIKENSEQSEIMNLMYYSLLIFMSEHLKVPKSLMMALGNDLEKNRDNMESGELITTYVTILSELWIQNKNKKE